MKVKRGIGLLVLLVFIILIIFLAFQISPSKKSTASAKFQTSSTIVKVSEREGESVKIPFSISRGSGGYNFELSNLAGVSLNSGKIIAGNDGNGGVELTFNSANLKPGIYVGNLKITGAGAQASVPVIFEVETKEVSFDLSLEIPTQYTEVASGDKIVAQIKIFDLTTATSANGLGSQEVTLDYNIYNLNGQAISFQKENVIVQKDAQLTKSVSLPADIKEGDYVIGVVVRYGSSVGSSTNIFNVKNRSNFYDSAKSNNSLLFLILGLLLLFLIMIAFFIYLLRYRDKYLAELNRHYAAGMRGGKRLIAAQVKVIKSKSGMSQKEIKKVEKEAKEKIRKLEEKLNERRKNRAEEVRRLKKKGEMRQLKRKLEEWKRAGYNISGMELKMRTLSKGDMQRILNDWKKKYPTEGYKSK